MPTFFPIKKRLRVRGYQVKVSIPPQILEFSASSICYLGNELECVANLENIIITKVIVPATYFRYHQIGLFISKDALAHYYRGPESRIFICRHANLENNSLLEIHLPARTQDFKAAKPVLMVWILVAVRWVLLVSVNPDRVILEFLFLLYLTEWLLVLSGLNV